MNHDSTESTRTVKKFLGLLKVFSVFAILYCFLVSIGMIGAAFKGLGMNFVQTLIHSSAGPLIGLFIGLLTTSVIQSSSTTTSLVVGMVAAGAFGEDPHVAVAAAVPYIMGANIGTSVTNLIVSMGYIGNKEEFKRAFSASIVHDFFNVLSVLILFPLQLNTGIISKSANILTSFFIGTESFTFKSPVRTITEPAVHVIEGLFEHQGLVNPDLLLLIAALALLFLSLRYLTVLIRSLVMHKLEAFFDTHIFKTGLRAMIFGVFITVLVQSSSITTSLVVPMAGAGILSLYQIFPYTLGANIGTTVTALLASLVCGCHAPLAVAFSHLLFNMFGIAIIWPIPRIRQIPLYMAEHFAEISTRNRILPFIYILIAFFVIPLGLIFLVR